MKQHRSAAYSNPQHSAKNDLLHPKNPYFRRPLDFFELYRQFPEELEPYITVRDHFKRKAFFDWKNPGALRALTKVLLRRDFGISLPRSIPVNFLCPPLPNRLNYLCFLDDLTQSCTSLTEDLMDTFGVKRPLIVDIGTGVLGIYALLGAVVFRMRFLASDVSSESLEFLLDVLKHNPQLAADILTVHVPESTVVQEQIKLCLRNSNNSLDINTIASCTSNPSSWGPIRQLFFNSGQERLYYRLLDANHQFACHRVDRRDEGEHGNSVSKKQRQDEDASTSVAVSSTSASTSTRYKTIISAVMTNPPFYDDDEVILDNEETVCSGNPVEMRTTGGEVAFITSMIIDSIILRESVLWYTAMVGKKSSLKTLRQILQFYGIPSHQIFETSFAQGVTYRWAIAWTFSEEAASLYHSFTMLNVTNAADCRIPANTDDQSHSENPSSNENEISLTVAQFEETMTLSEKISSIPHTAPLNGEVGGIMSRCVQRLTGCLDHLGEHLSHQNFQGFESISYMTPLGHMNTVKWNVHSEYNIQPIVDVTNKFLVTILCRLLFLTSATNSKDSLLNQSQTSEALKPLLDLRCTITLHSAVKNGSIMDIDDSLQPQAEQLLIFDVQTQNSFCAASLANKLCQRSRDFIEGDILRSNRRWRRALQREQEGN